VIDGKGKTREILRYTLTIQNDTKHMLELYPWVADVDAATGVTGSSDLGGGSPGDTRTASPSRWIEITRAQTLILPGEKKEIPLLLQIDLNAKPGMYHALVHVSQGGNRAEAEANTTGTENVAINIEVLDDIHERLELNTFIPEKNFFSGNAASFSYAIANIGNRGLTPTGKIHIFDRRGEEVAAIDANKDGRRLEPNQKEMLASVWSANGEFGRYKAMIELDYGARGMVQDTVYFWIMPWTKLLGMFGALAVIVVIVALMLQSWGAARRGGHKLAFAVASGERDEFNAYSPYDDDAIRDAYVDGITDISIPAPSRTRYEKFEEEDKHAHESVRQGRVELLGHQVHLAKKERHIDPAHVVTLGKRR
jgi:hypothetical protein